MVCAINVLVFARGLQAPVTQQLPVESYTTWQMLQGWYGIEQLGGAAGRWSGADASIDVPPGTSGTVAFSLRLIAPNPPGTLKLAHVTLGSQPVGLLEVGPQVRTYHLLTALPAWPQAPQLTINTAAVTSAADPRALGVGLTQLALNGPFHAPLPLAAVLTLIAAVGLLWAVLHAILPGFGWSWAGVLVLVVASAGLAHLDRGLTVSGLPWLVAALLGINLVAQLSIRHWGREVAQPWLLLLLIMLAGAGLRAWNLNWDDGAQFHPDEWAFNQAARQLQYPWHPRFFAYGSLPIYLYHGTAVLLNAVMGTERWLSDAAQFTLIGRAFAALLSTATIGITALLGWRLGGRAAGLWSALMLAGAVLAIQNAHYGTTDTLLALQVLLLMYASLAYLRRPRWQAMLAAGVVLGAGLATKATAVTFVLIPGATLALADWQARRRRDHQWKLLAQHSSVLLGATVVFCVLCAPYYVLDWQGLLQAISTEEQDATTGLADYTYQFIDAVPLVYHAYNALFTLGPPLVLLGVAGWGFVLFQAVAGRSVPAVLLAAWPTVFLLFLGTLHTKYVRYTLLLLPFLCLYAGLMLAALAQGARWRQRMVAWLGGLTGALTLGYGLVYAFGVYQQPDPRLAASAWLYTHVPPNSMLLVEEHDLRLPVELRDLQPPRTVVNTPAQFNLAVLKLYTPPLMESMAYYADVLAAGQYWLISSRSQHVTFARLPQQFPVRSCLYRQLMAGKLGYTPVQTFSRGPQLGAWRIDDAQNPGLDETFQVFDHPTVMIFRKTAALSVAELQQALTSGCR